MQPRASTLRSVVRVAKSTRAPCSGRGIAAHRLDSPGGRRDATNAGAGSALRWLCGSVVGPFVHQSATVRVICIAAIVSVALVRSPAHPCVSSRHQVLPYLKTVIHVGRGEQVGSATAAALWLRGVATTAADAAHAACIARARNLLRQLASSSTSPHPSRPTLPAAARATSVDQAHRLLLCGCFQQLLDCEQVCLFVCLWGLLSCHSRVSGDSPSFATLTTERVREAGRVGPPQDPGRAPCIALHAVAGAAAAAAAAVTIWPAAALAVVPAAAMAVGVVMRARPALRFFRLAVVEVRSLDSPVVYPHLGGRWSSSVVSVVSGLINLTAERVLGDELKDFCSRQNSGASRAG